jgi:hypothetical protein
MKQIVLNSWKLIQNINEWSQGIWWNDVSDILSTIQSQSVQQAYEHLALSRRTW